MCNWQSGSMALFTLLLCVLFVPTSAVKNVPNVVLTKPIHPEKNDDIVAFSAELSEHAEVVPGGAIVFDRTITNVGGLYNNTSGQFVCSDGLYVFIWNLSPAIVSELPGMRCIGSLSGEGVVRKYGPKNSYYAGSSSGVAEMISIHDCSNNPLSAVTITSQPWNEDSNSVFNRGYTSFSGFKLQSSIAFTTELSEDQLELPPGLRIMFDNVIANAGGYYDAVNGRFRCPDNGVYVFSISSHTKEPSSQWSVSRLMMEGEVLIQGPISYIATDDYDSGSVSTTVVLQCTADFSVYVEAQQAYDFRDNSYGAKLTSFAGFKLYDISTDTVAFTALMTQNFTAASINDPVPFDEVITNIGGAFNTTNSSFVCPDDSYYLFTWTAVTTPLNAIIDLHKDGVIVKHLITTQIGSSSAVHTSGSCTQSVILQCQTGSVFQVVHKSSSRTLLGGYTSFSGYKLPG